MIAHELKMKVIQVSSIEQWLSIPKPESRKCKKSLAQSLKRVRPSWSGLMGLSIAALA
jgi:hypothetical protein